MNYWGWFWLAIYAYRNGLINRKEFIEHWKENQLLESQIKDNNENKKA